MGLVLPEEARDTPPVWTWLERMVAGNGPIRKLFVVDVRQSMANGCGPACLRLRAVADPATAALHFLAAQAQLAAITEKVREPSPESVQPPTPPTNAKTH